VHAKVVMYIPYCPSPGHCHGGGGAKCGVLNTSHTAEVATRLHGRHGNRVAHHRYPAILARCHVVIIVEGGWGQIRTFPHRHHAACLEHIVHGPGIAKACGQ
jgi:hypothetical protein